MAQYAVLLYPRDSADPARDAADTAAHQRHSDELVASGALVGAFALTPRDMATSISGDTITDGPFLDAKAVVAGFYVIEAADLDAALAIAQRCPAVHNGGVEVRPVAGSLTPGMTTTGSGTGASSAGGSGPGGSGAGGSGTPQR